jgi:hypothetical protein
VIANRYHEVLNLHNSEIGPMLELANFLGVAARRGPNERSSAAAD